VLRIVGSAEDWRPMIDGCHLCGGRGSFGPNAQGVTLECPCRAVHRDGPQRGQTSRK
jgi:hypothetical protein